MTSPIWRVALARHKCFVIFVLFNIISIRLCLDIQTIRSERDSLLRTAKRSHIELNMIWWHVNKIIINANIVEINKSNLIKRIDVIRHYNTQYPLDIFDQYSCDKFWAHRIELDRAFDELSKSLESKNNQDLSQLYRLRGKSENIVDQYDEAIIEYNQTIRKKAWYLPYSLKKMYFKPAIVPGELSNRRIGVQAARA